MTKPLPRAIAALFVLVIFAAISLPLSVQLPCVFLDWVCDAYKLKPYDQVPSWAVSVLDWSPYVILLGMPLVGGLIGHRLQRWMLNSTNGVPNHTSESACLNATRK